MASLTTARTRLGLYGYATRPTGSFIRGGLPSIETPFGGFVDAEDAVLTLLATANAIITWAAAADSAVPSITNVDADVSTLTISDAVVTRVTAFDHG